MNGFHKLVKNLCELGCFAKKEKKKKSIFFQNCHSHTDASWLELFLFKSMSVGNKHGTFVSYLLKTFVSNEIVKSFISAKGKFM